MATFQIAIVCAMFTMGLILGLALGITLILTLVALRASPDQTPITAAVLPAAQKSQPPAPYIPRRPGQAPRKPQDETAAQDGE